MNQRQLTYVTASSAVACTATTVGTANVILTASAVVLGSSDKVQVQFYCPSWQSSSAYPTVSYLQVFLATNAGAATAVGRIWDGAAFETGQKISSILASFPNYTPGAGSQVFSVRGFTDSGTFTVGAGTGGAGTEIPMCMRVIQVA